MRMERALRVLEFAEVQTDILSFVTCSLGRARLEHLQPCATCAKAEQELAVVDEALQFALRFGAPPFGGITDVRPALQKTTIGGALSAAQLLAVADFIRGGRRVRQALQAHVEEESHVRLQVAAESLFDARQTEVEIREKVLEDATLADRASSELQRLRQERRSLEQRVRHVLDDWLRRHAKLLQEPIVAMRGDSFCLPVRAEFKNQVPGIVHDVSASGQTVFIEPQPVVEANQRVRALLLEEDREVERILLQLSGVVAGVADDLLQNAEVLGWVDAWFAKAGHAKARGWQRPGLREDGVWKLRQARHPLIDPATAVPLDVTLGETYTMLLVTGPNTGGKTVTLKTIGLLTLLAMSGCFIPTRLQSDISWCDEVFVDIGDEQSIEQSLSTFSSHMRNVIPLFSEVTANSLVLLDELGAGTDPAEGATLAMAILDELNERGCRVAVTTHYPELKAYAFREQNAMNASVEFDVATLRPTYRLSIGVPGRSNALAIAQRLGMPTTVIGKARAMLKSDDVRVEDLILQIEQARKDAEAALQAATADRDAARTLRETLEAERTALSAEVDRVRRRTLEQAQQDLARAQSEAERIIQELRRMQRDGGVRDHELVSLRKQLESAIPQGPERVRASGAARQSAQPGAVVRVLSLGQKGEVLEADGDHLVVQLGVLRMKVRSSDVEILQNKQVHDRPTVQRRGLPKDVRLELDVRGETVEEATFRVDKYLDDAVQSGLQRVAIIHGKGTGALRDGVRRYLSGHTHVAGTAPGGPGEGGDGVTVVMLR